jgi:transcriptional regulator with GAF, ATPase, and Fis domain
VRWGAARAMDEEVRFRLLYDLGCAFAARIEIDQLIPLVVTKCREALDAEGASVLLLDDERKELYFPYISEEDPVVAERLVRLRFSAELGIAAAALKGGKALVVNDAQNDPRLYHGIDKMTGLVTRNVLAAPLSTRQGTIGVVEVVNGRGAKGFTADDLSFLEAISGSIAIAIENARLYTQVRESEASLQTQVGALRRDLARHDAFTEIVGTGPAMAEVLRLMDTAAASSITVLILGETGTGKELVARGLHRASARSEHPFLALNCAAMPEPLLESELFGHRRGAFTGAIRDNPGLFRAAAGGVVFLDEVADMPLPMQAKLLRVLEEQEVVPVGDSFPRKVDVRVLSATNRDPRAEVAAGRFRQDLYYRLAVFPIALPPLRERREDIPLLATRFLAIAAELQRKPIAGLDPAALELLTQYGWPGNVRELRNEIDRAVALARASAIIAPEHLSASLRAPGALTNGAPANHTQPRGAYRGVPMAAAAPAPPESQDARGDDAKGPLRRARAAFEADFIAKVLDEHRGNVSRAAVALGLSRASLQKKMKEYALR